MSCNTPRPPSVVYSTLSPCDRLAVVEDALFAIASGDKKTVIRHGDFWVEKVPGDVRFLERERARLTELCGETKRRAIKVGRSRGWPC